MNTGFVSKNSFNRVTRGLLLVDDHTIVREGVKRILATTIDAWVVTEASSAFEALECLKDRSFALAIVDLSMPGMNGLELFPRLSRPNRPL